MALKCLKRIDSEEEMRRIRMKEMQDDHDNHRLHFKFWSGRVNRSWSGNLSTNENTAKPSFNKMRSRSSLGPANKRNKAPAPIHRLTNSGPAAFDPDQSTPRLVRSSGMRRDWSFEDVRRVIAS